jgi:glucan phosphorylase
MEFMLSEALPIYSGGLGNVAGDQLKAASDLGVPVVAVGLLYSQGYFRQVIDDDGAQRAVFPFVPLRPNLLLHDPERLLRLLNDPVRPMQLVLAGKAHPADAAGQALIREWSHFIARHEARHRVVFLSDYDMLLCGPVVQGIDVWLNTPRRPWEASGTSGMKVLVNGGLNLSERTDGGRKRTHRTSDGRSATVTSMGTIRRGTRSKPTRSTNCSNAK